jgi:two-component system, chemotaxis family, response regulator PixG
MVYTEPQVSNKLLNDLKDYINNKRNGKLDFISLNGVSWSLYFRLGRIMWATGGIHPFRRWRRQMALHCPNINVNSIRLHAQDLEVEHWDYQLLSTLYKSGNIDSKQVDAISSSVIGKILFEIMQQLYLSPINCHFNPDVILDLPINFINPSVFIKRVEKEWEIWESVGLKKVSPNLAPLLKRKEDLQHHLSPGAYENVVKLANGKNTLRDLSVKMKQGVLQVACSLSPYISNDFVELVEVPDLPLPGCEKLNYKNYQKSKLSNAPLVACIDDSPLVGQMLEQIIIANEMRFIAIKEAIQALPTLIEHKPDFIFLDLIMPVVNGYEICTQIRRISHFANTPIVILTGSDGLIDRVRAKVVGSTDFMTKPIVPDKVTAVIQKYLKIIY